MKLVGLLIAATMLLNVCPDALDEIRAAQDRSVTISFTGDCTISTDQGRSEQGTFNWYAKNYEPTYFLEKVADIFNEDDITVVNCETVLSDRNLTKRYKGEGTAYWFIGPASNAKIFSSSGVEVASVVNNHTNDFGAEGAADTVAALEAEGLDVLEAKKPVYIERKGITIGFLGAGIWWGGQEKELYKVLEEMEENSDIQIIYPHGGAEGSHEVEAWRKTSFRNLIDHGADIIVGTHSHRLQPLEEYHGGVIVYGLGNFCFGGNRYPQNRTAIYQLIITPGEDGYVYENSFIPCYVYTGSSNNWQPAPVPETDAAYRKILDFMAGELETPV